MGHGVLGGLGEVIIRGVQGLMSRVRGKSPLSTVRGMKKLKRKSFDRINRMLKRSTGWVQCVGGGLGREEEGEGI